MLLLNKSHGHVLGGHSTELDVEQSEDGMSPAEPHVLDKDTESQRTVSSSV